MTTREKFTDRLMNPALIWGVLLFVFSGIFSVGGFTYSTHSRLAQLEQSQNKKDAAMGALLESVNRLTVEIAVTNNELKNLRQRLDDKR